MKSINQLLDEDCWKNTNGVVSLTRRDAERLMRLASAQAYEKGLSRGILCGKPCPKSAALQYPDAKLKKEDIDLIFKGEKKARKI